jgi:nucleotide-binding universal stress UspA family protein
MKILVPVDGSTSSKTALRFVASRFADAQRQPTIELLNVQLPIPARPARYLGGRIVHAYHDEESSKVLVPALATLSKAGLAARATAVVGHPGEAVSDAARRVDLVVMGAHGRTATAGLLLGSVTNTVLASCSTPLLILRGKGRALTKTNRPAPRVGIAIDGSEYGLAAVRYVLKHRDLFGPVPNLTLIHVVADLLSAYVPGLAMMPMPTFSPEQAADAQTAAFEAAIAPARKILKRAGLVAAEARLISNATGDEIAEYARKNRLDMLFMGSHGHGAFTSVVLGSVATRVAARCDTPLLLIRGK